MKSSLEFLKTKSKQSGLEFLIHLGVRKFFDDGTSVKLTTNNQLKIAPQHKDYVQPTSVIQLAAIKAMSD
jgi:hypothetical protein